MTILTVPWYRTHNNGTKKTDFAGLVGMSVYVQLGRDAGGLTKRSARNFASDV